MTNIIKNDPLIISYRLNFNIEFLTLYGEVDADYLPLMLFPKDVERFSQEGTFEMKPINLLFGLVYGYHEIDNRILDRDRTKKEILRMLHEHFEHSDDQTFELMLLDMSVAVKSMFDVLTYRRFLLSCALIYPDGDEIKRDLIIADWVSMIVKPTMPPLYDEIIDLYHQLDLKSLDELGKKVVTLYCVFAIIKSNKPSDQIEEFLIMRFYRIVDETHFLKLIDALLSDPEQFNVSSLLITSQNVAKWKLMADT